MVVSWGRLSIEPHSVMPLHDRTTLNLALTGSEDQALAWQRSQHGDVCLNPGRKLWTTRGLDRFIAYDTKSGVLDCEAGVLLKEIIESHCRTAGFFR
jgi:hypothetical protein